MQEPPAAQRRRRVSLWGLVEAAGILACFASLLGFAGRLNWLLELTSHFRVQLAAILVLLTAVCLASRRWRWSGLFAGFGVVNLVLVIAVARPTPPAETAATASRLRLLSINVHTANTRADLVIDEIRRRQPDVVLLMEVDEPWLKALEPLRADFPFVIAEPRVDNFGIALLSRMAVEQPDIIELGGAEVPSVAVTLHCGERRVRLLGTHPVPPGTPATSSARNDQLRAIAEWSRRQSGPVVVLGDLNVTPWSPHFGDLLSEGGLKRSHPSWCVAASWPTQFPAGLRIPLDHCLISPGLVVTRYETGETVGSDHLPLRVELVVP